MTRSNVLVTSDGRELLADGFEDLGYHVVHETLRGWNLLGPHWSRYGWIRGWEPGPTGARVENEAWEDLRLQADVDTNGPYAHPAGIEIGGETFSRFSLTYNGAEFALTWSFVPPDGSDLDNRQVRLSAAIPAGLQHPTVPNAIQPMRLILEATAGTVSASVMYDPVVWWLWDEEILSTQWRSIAPVENIFAITVDRYACSVTPDGDELSRVELSSWVSETRTWGDPNGRGTMAGVCQPYLNRILLGLVPRGGAGRWGGYLRQEVGPLLDPGEGGLIHPISFDVGPDGRIYVLDAGNSRIVAFGADRRYTTQWGVRGARDGEFDFGLGTSLITGLSFAGSICVDDEGYIYVADVFNERIQKFAP